ncbi:MAG: hypothetical protein GY870_19845, partial [archaeon]|nr:hypothetical protein [archaeon]
MDNDRLLMEAQLIATKFSFWMVKGKIDHLYGYIYESPDGKTKYALEILYNETFPEKAPDFSFPQEIPNLAGDIELNSISEWTSKSHVIDIVSELAKIVKIAIEGKVEPQEFEKIPEVQIDSNNDEQSKNDEEIVIVNESEIDETSEEYITPSMDEYQYDSEEPVSNPNDLPVWGEEEEIKVEEIQDNNVNELSSENIQSENNTSDANIDVTTESALIQQEYAMDYIDNFVGKVEIYLT